MCSSYISYHIAMNRAYIWIIAVTTLHIQEIIIQNCALKCFSDLGHLWVLALNCNLLSVTFEQNK
jgi:hypothetical protein